MAGAHAGARLGRLAAEAVGRAGHRPPAPRRIAAPPGSSEASATTAGSKAGVKVRGARGCLGPGLDGPAFRLPGRKAAFEDRHVARAEDPEGPAHARRREQAGAVIDDDGRVRRRCPSRRPPAANSSGDGSMWGRAEEVSLTLSMSNRTAPGMWPARYSACGSRFCVGRYQEPSTTTRSGSSRCSCSHAVETKGWDMGNSFRFERMNSSVDKATGGRGGSACPSSRCR